MLFSIECLLVALAIPIFREMFADFGAPLPWLTLMTLNARPLLLAVGTAAVAWSIALVRMDHTEGRYRILKIVCLAVFFVALSETVAFSLPIFQLGSVAAVAK